MTIVYCGSPCKISWLVTICLLIPLCRDRVENTVCNCYSIVVFLFFAKGACLPFPCMDVCCITPLFIRLLHSNVCTCYIIYTLQQHLFKRKSWGDNESHGLCYFLWIRWFLREWKNLTYICICMCLLICTFYVLWTECLLCTLWNLLTKLYFLGIHKTTANFLQTSLTKRKKFIEIKSWSRHEIDNHSKQKTKSIISLQN
jgi:hypothetical protein